MNHAKHSIPFFLLLAACNTGGGESPPAAEAPAPAPAAAPAEHAEHAAAAPTGELPPVPEGAKVEFAEPTDGATVTGPLKDGKVEVTVKMAAQGIAVKPAGPVEAGSGHHHILIDTADIPQGGVIPNDETHVHFGKGQTETTLALAPGEHTLTMQLADGIHRSYGPALSARIKIKVEAGEAAAEGAEPEATAEGEGTEE